MVVVPDVSPVVVVAVAAFLVFVGVVKGCLGFGAGLLSVPVLIQVFDPTLALAALSLTLWVANVPILVDGGVRWRFVLARAGLVGTAVVGVVVGLAGVSALPAPIVYLLVSGFVVGVLLLGRHERRLRRLAAMDGAGVVVGGIGGLVVGAFLAGGPLFVSYLHATRTEKAEFATTLALIFFILTSVRIGSLAVAGSFGAGELVYGVGFLVPLAAGVHGGTRLRPHVPQRRFELVVEALLVVIAAKLAVDGFTALV